MSQVIFNIPKDLLLGFSSSSYQIEGGWNEDGKGESVWDRYTHINQDKIKDKSNGDIAADSYHKYKDDVKCIRDIGGQIYRFSISWPRILPNGFSNVINQAGIDYYTNLIEELLANNVEPMVTLFHWDLPQSLQNLGGWTNPRIADYFADYARICFQNFGHLVKKWITLNEPREQAHGYGGNYFAPALEMKGIAEYLAGHTMLKAHAKAYHIYNNEFRNVQKGIIGISLSSCWFTPKKPEDLQYVSDYIQLHLGWFAHPIFIGDYPEFFKKKVEELSLKNGFKKTQLPKLSEKWISLIKGTSDFFGLNHYTTFCVESSDGAKDYGYKLSSNDDWPKSASSWLRVVPWGFRKLLNFVKTEYGNPTIFITENGVSDNGVINDQERIDYLKGYMKELLKAIHLDDVNIKVYCIWSILDNFEWGAGYTEKFGVISVDFNDPDLKRTPKKSAEFLKQVFSSRYLN